MRTQVIPYLREIVKDGVEMHLLTFEPENLSREDVESETRALAEQGITWHRRRYHKWPSVPATFYDILVGAFAVRSLTKRFGFDILHARVHVPALMAAVARKLMRQKPKILFDIRGFVPEEYADAAVWKENGLLFRIVKRIERWLFKESDGFIVLTEKARDLIFAGSRDTGTEKHGRPVEVIPCCVDIDERFNFDPSERRKRIREQLGISERFVITHVGALGGLYLTDAIVDLLVAARTIRPDTFALFLTQTGPRYVIELLEQNGFGKDDHFVGKVPSDQVPEYLQAADIGLSIVKATYATQSRSPTKIPEYLAAGLPIIANAGVGDVDALITENGVGILLENFGEQSYRAAIETVLEMGDISERCRAVAREHFDLESVGGARYRRLYQKLLQT